MAERKLDLPQHSETQDHPNIKVLCLDGDSSGFFSGNPDAELKDVTMPENVIPLSPQWLHSRIAETKEPRTPNSFSQSGSTDTNLKEQWRLEGSLDKKDWRRTAPESDGGRRWREEERENTAVARRDRRKEGEREIDTRKADRRSENTSQREVADNKHPNSTDRWQDTTSREPGHEARRDRKWSPAWGPENNEKDVRREKRSEVEKEDGGLDRQPSFSNSRLAADRDSDKSSTDKWRPSRLREKLRVQKDGVGFLAGRGRGSGLTNNLSMRTPIGASNNTNAFCYPRAKLLDIYRDCGSFSSLRGVADGFVEVSGVTCSEHVEPLAFVSPGPEEQAGLEDISKGKVAGSEAVRKTFTNIPGRVYNEGLGISEDILSKSNKKSACDESVSSVMDDSQLKPPEDVLPDLDESELVDSFSKEIAIDTKERYSVSSLYDFKDEIFIPKASSDVRGPAKSLKGISEYPLVEGSVSAEVCYENENLNSSGLGNPYDILSMKGIASVVSGERKTTKEVEVTSSELPIRLPSDASVLYDDKSFEGTPGGCDFEDGELENKGGIKLGDQGSLLEELSLFYKDPQGDIQGPFLGIDIIQWFEQGFFGTDLLVCLSDAPEGTPFQPLGELMLHLRQKPHSSHGFVFEDSKESKGRSSRSGHDISSKKIGIEYERQNSIHNPEQDKTLSDFSEQTRAGLTDRGLSFPDMLKSTRRNTLDHEEKHCLESGADKNAEILARIIQHGRGIPPAESIGSLERHRMSSLSQFDSDDSIAPWQSEANAFGSVWPQQEVDQFIDIRSGLLDATVSSSISSHMLSMMSRMQSLPNNQRQDLFHSRSLPPIDRAWPETFQRDAHSSNNIFNVASDPHLMTHSEQNLQRIERADLFFNHQLEQKKQKQQQQQHQQQMLMQRQLQSGATLLDQGTISGMGHNFDNSLLQHHQPLQPRQQLPGPPMPPSALVLDPISRLQLQQQQHQPQHHLQLQPNQQQPQHHMQLEHQRQSHQTGLDQLLPQMYDPSYAQSHIPSGGSSIDQLMLRQEGMRHDSQPHHQPIRRQGNSMDLSLSLEQLLHQRRHELSSNQFPLPSQRQFIDERRVSGVWAVDESGEFVQTQAPTLHPFDLYQSHQQILNTQPQHSQLLNFQSSSTLASNAEINYPHLFERAELHDHNIEGRSLHGMHDSNMSRLTDLPSMNMDFTHSLKQAQERRVQERYNATRLTGQDEQFPSEIMYNSRPLPMAFHGIQSEVMNGIWEKPSSTQSSDLHIQGPGFFMQQGQPFDFITESQGQKLRRAGINWKSNEGSSEHVSSEELHRRSLISTHTADLETRQSHGDSLHQKFAPRSVSSSVMPGNVLATSSEQSQCMWTAVNSRECISGCTYDSSDLISSQLFKNRRNEDLSEVLEDLAVNGVGSTYMGHNSASEIKMRTGISVDGGYDGMHSEAFIEEPFYSSKNNELQLSLPVADSLVQSTRVDIDSLEFKEARKNKRRSSKGRGAVKVTAVSSSDASSVSNFSTGDSELSQNQQALKHESSNVQELSSWSSDFSRGVSVHTVMDTKKSIQRPGQSVVESNSADGRMRRDNGDQMSTVERENSKFSAKAFDLSDLAASPLSTVQGKLQSNRRTSHEAGECIAENAGGNLAVKPSENAFQRKENLPISNVSKTSAFSDADTRNDGAKSFLNTLKNSKKPEAEKEKSKVDSSAILDSDSQGSKSTKKKGKKGRQIDPSLLGFKVTSNRINMGEIQHPDD